MENYIFWIWGGANKKISGIYMSHRDRAYKNNLRCHFKNTY